MSISATKTDPAKFGDFTALCQRAALIVCPLLQSDNGVEPNCYSRNVQLGSQLIFQPGESRLQFSLLLSSIRIWGFSEES